MVLLFALSRVPEQFYPDPVRILDESERCVSFAPRFDCKPSADLLQALEALLNIFNLKAEMIELAAVLVRLIEATSFRIVVQFKHLRRERHLKLYIDSSMFHLPAVGNLESKRSIEFQ